MSGSLVSNHGRARGRAVVLGLLIIVLTFIMVMTSAGTPVTSTTVDDKGPTSNLFFYISSIRVNVSMITILQEYFNPSFARAPDTSNSFVEWIDTSRCRETECKPNEACFSNNKGNVSCHSRSQVAHLVLLVDKNVTAGLITTLHSIITNTKTNLKIYVVTNGRDYAEVQGNIDCISLPDNIVVAVIVFNLPLYIKDLIKVHSSSHQYLTSTENFARLFLANVLVELDYVLYVDCDTIVRGDLGDLWRELYKTDQILAAASFGRFRPSALLRERYAMRYRKNVSTTARTINNGVLGMNLKKWRDKDIKKEVLFWMAANKESRLWILGSQPIMNIICAEDLKSFPETWNYRLWQHRGLSATAKIVHLNGRCKPWNVCRMQSGREAWTKLWKDYDKGLCTRNGQCILENNTGTCQCNEGYSGNYCQNKSAR